MKSQMQRGKATRGTDFYRYFSLIILIALALVVRQPAFASPGAAHGEGGQEAVAAHGEAAESEGDEGHGEHACPEGAICLHPHEHEFPELANIVDGIRAKLAKALFASDKGSLESGEDGELILTDDNADFIKAGIGSHIYPDSQLLNRVEDMQYTVWILKGEHEGRYVITRVEKNRLTMESGHEAGKGGHENKLEPAAEISYQVKEEHTLSSRLVGAGLMGLNWNDLANIFFALFAIIILTLFSIKATRKPKKIPSGLQAFTELIISGLDEYTRGLIGPDSRKYLPFLGTIFLYILCMALIGLIPFIKSPIALNLNIPLSMAVCVFLFVQYHGLRQNGIKNYIKHFTGEKVGIIVLDQFLMILNTFLHILGEFIKPISLSLRLYANISAEDILVAVLVLMAVSFPVWLPLPIQVLFFPLALMFSGIQALVFMSLSAIYISQMSAHQEHSDEEGHQH